MTGEKYEALKGSGHKGTVDIKSSQELQQLFKCGVIMA